jgi:hypothetical protein
MPRGLPIAAVLLLVAGCATYRPVRREEVARDPAMLVGKHVQLRTADGKTEVIEVLRVEGTTILGRRLWRPGCSTESRCVAPAEETAMDLETVVAVAIVETGEQAPYPARLAAVDPPAPAAGPADAASDAPASAAGPADAASDAPLDARADQVPEPAAPSPEPEAEVAAPEGPPDPAQLVGMTVRFRTARGRTSWLQVVRVEETKVVCLPLWNNACTTAARCEAQPNEVTIEATEITGVEVMSDKFESVAGSALGDAVVFTGALAVRAVFTLALAALVLLVAL